MARSSSATRAVSVRLRLTLLYSTILALTLLVFGLFLYLRTEQDQRAEVDRTLRTSVDRILAGTGAAPGSGATPGAGSGTPVAEPGGAAEPARRSGSDVLRLGFAARLGDPAILVQLDDNTGRPLLDAGGQPVFQSPNLNEAPLPAPHSTSRHYENVTVNHVPLRMLVTPVDLTQRSRAAAAALGTSSGPQLVLAAQSLVDTNRTLEQLRFILIAGSIVCLGLAALAGWLMARKALEPIARLTDEARDIGRRQDFKRRVKHPGPDDEVGRLAATFNAMLDSLGEAHERVQRALDAQRRFVADASHELRTPLTTIRGNVELLCLEGADGEDQQEALGDIASEAERMSRLVNNLLALARADAGFQIPRGPVLLEQIVAEAMQKARRLADTVNLRLLANAPAIVQGDRDYLLQLLLILLDNALKYTPADGNVTVASVRSGDSVRVSVSDTGPGISPKDQARIFDRFYRADVSRHGEGTGLGLAIACWVAEELGGRIELESTVGRGSTFTVVLPFAGEPAGELAELAVVAGAGMGAGA